MHGYWWQHLLIQLVCVSVYMQLLKKPFFSPLEVWLHKGKAFVVCVWLRLQKFLVVFLSNFYFFFQFCLCLILIMEVLLVVHISSLSCYAHLFVHRHSKLLVNDMKWFLVSIYSRGNAIDEHVLRLIQVYYMLLHFNLEYTTSG